MHGYQMQEDCVHYTSMLKEIKLKLTIKLLVNIE